MEYPVCIEKNGQMVKAGIISGSKNHARFRYSDDYLSCCDAAALSISLPLTDEYFSPVKTLAFFDGLLPEGFTRRTVESLIGCDRDDYLKVLSCMGHECAGAVCVFQNDAAEKECYERLSPDIIKKIAAWDARICAEMVLKAGESLPGASGKVCLYCDEKKNEWYLPHFSSGTHIVKQRHVRFPGIVVNEQLCLMTAEKCGIDAAESFIVNTGERKDSDILLAVKRFDRKPFENISGAEDMKSPVRIHQEDFAQALGVPSLEKYEKAGERYLADMFRLLRKYSSQPDEDIIKLWDMIIFDWLIGNTDAHLKNFAFLYSADMQKRRLAPAYDIVSTTVYSQIRPMAFSIGGSVMMDSIDVASFKKAACEAGIDEKTAMDRFDRMSGKIISALNESCDSLVSSGYKNAETVRDRILKTGGIKSIVY